MPRTALLGWNCREWEELPVAVGLPPLGVTNKATEAAMEAAIRMAAAPSMPRTALLGWNCREWEELPVAVGLPPLGVTNKAMEAAIRCLFAGPRDIPIHFTSQQSLHSSPSKAITAPGSSRTTIMARLSQITIRTKPK